MKASLPDAVRIVEVGPRDGLQNESTPISTVAKLQFIDALVKSGLRDIEVASFVHPKAVPQLADATELIVNLPRAPWVRYSALVPNEKGLDRAIEAGVRRIAVFTAASETFTQKNIGMSIGESLKVFERVCHRALGSGMTIRGYVSTAFVCPFEGNIASDKVATISQSLLAMGVDEVAISDTIGAAGPVEVERMIGELLASVSAERIALHLHNTFGTALANVYAAMQLGISTFDSSAGGLGGCPFAPGAAGNLATEDLVYMLNRMGIHSGVKLDGILKAAEVIGSELGHSLRSAVWQQSHGQECQRQVT